MVQNVEVRRNWRIIEGGRGGANVKAKEIQFVHL